MERAVYRIIDANFNRAREALRVIEEFCRFTLNSSSFTERAKGLRHRLCILTGQIDKGKMIASRDTAGDVGVGLSVAGQMQRRDLQDVLTAGCKRLTEALRVLAETAATIDPALAGQIEQLRYEAYELEKDCLIFSSTIAKYGRVKLYIVISSELPVDVLRLVQQCIAGGADCIQLRSKTLNDDQLFALAVEFVQACRAENVLSIINDRVDVAAAAGADGVHLGQNDLPVEQAYKLQMSPLIIGKSTHSIEQLKAALLRPRRTCGGLTYVGLGPVYATPTKPTAPPVGLGYVRSATEFLADKAIGHVAIGGITIDNVEEVLRAGAKTIAVSSAAAKAANPKDVCRQLKEKILSFKVFGENR
jgi:thiamine-phosphate pyrophosphorylase